MGNLKYTITSNQPNGVHQASPGWCVAFIRYKNPVCGYSTTQSLLDTKPILVVENDCIGMVVNNTKGSFAKTMTLTMKAGDVYYFNAVSPGDWVCAWMSDAQDDIANIVGILDGNRFSFQKENSITAPTSDSTNTLNNFKSGFKFLGRVINVANSDTMQGTKRIVTQTITCQAFLELTSSVYFTYQATLGRFTHETGGTTDQEIQTAQAQDQAKAQQQYTNLLVGQVNGIHFAGFSQQFFQFMVNSAKDPKYSLSPDKVIKFLIILLMGMNSGDLGVGSKVGPTKGNFNDSIRVPPAISWITGLSNATRLWQFYNVVLGVQQFDESNQKYVNTSPWLIFNPILDPKTTKDHNILFTPNNCKGWVLFKPPVWNNVTYWDIFNQYLNPTLNEMYTVLKVDPYNRIRPHLVVREQPFSTGLFQTFPYTAPKQNEVNQILQSDSPPQNGIVTATNTSPDPTTGGHKPPVFTPINPSKIKEPRTMYNNLPRWVIDDTMIYAINVSTSEAARVNFIQVWGTNLGNAFAANPNSKLNSIENYKITQFLLGNYVADAMDIQRNGLRAEISETAFDLPLADGVQSHSPVWARMRADWKFNGHLKPAGTITLYGVTDPIAEGDNCQVHGVVYHIEAVNHSGLLQGSNKVFRAVLTVSNGILASSLRTDKDIPTYPAQLSGEAENNPGPGQTDAEFTGRPDRDGSGQRISSKKGTSGSNTNSGNTGAT